ncbi:MAG: ABC transporter ATP-binding protein/permease [Firmicutes bacterium]|jgi:ATP-binding cassette subfamily B protein|nr:ABC transporter ATP-binding protein/permease [Bacillota bacterium]
MMSLFRYLKPYWRQLLLVSVLLLVQSISNLYLPDLNARIINEGIAKGDIGLILRIGGFMLLVTLVHAGCSIVAVLFSAKAAMGFGRDLRRAVFSRVQSLSQREVNQFGAASLITRTTNDVQQMQMAVFMGFSVMFSAPIMSVGGIIMALRQDVPLSTSIVVIVPLMAALVGAVMTRALPLFKLQQTKIDRLNQVVREKITGARVIRAFVKTDYEATRFNDANADLTRTALTIHRTFALTMPSLMLIMNLSTAAILWFGAHRVDIGAMPLGNLTAFLAYVMQILMSVMIAVMMFVMVPRAVASAERIQAVLKTEPSIADPTKPVPAQALFGRVEFRNVEFTYPGAEAPVLKNISFTARPGETTAIVGSTGCGKSTLVNLIPRLYDVTGGAVLLDGVDIRQMTQEDLRDKVGFIPQKAFLFSGTVASNLRYGKKDATDEELWQALKIAQAEDFVRQMPGGLDAPIAQGGSNVSGGQRQRLAIARALVKRPPIYVFDDSFSALDFRTDARLRAALKEQTRDATVFIVAQRVSTIMDADQIVVLEDGLVAGIGAHAELMQSCEVYREIVYSQHSEEEIA